MDKPPRLMPERWFYGSLGNWLISGVTGDLASQRRALVPGERRLGAFIVPPFQRTLVWTTEQKVRLIESIYMGMPIGALVWNQTDFDHPCDGWLLDGQQRTDAICGYVAGAFPVRGWRYPDLPQTERRHFERMGIPVIETNTTDEALCREIYDRLLYGGAVPDGRG